MATRRRTKVYVSIVVEEIKDGDLGNPVNVQKMVYDRTFESGNGSNQMDLSYSDAAVSATTDYDVAGSLADSFGATITMSKLAIIAAHCKGSASTDVMRVGGDAASVPFMGAVGDFAVLGPDAFFLLVNPVGWTVTASTGDIVELTHTTGTYNHDALLVGKT